MLAELTATSRYVVVYRPGLYSPSTISPVSLTSTPPPEVTARTTIEYVPLRTKRRVEVGGDVRSRTAGERDRASHHRVAGRHRPRRSPSRPPAAASVAVKCVGPNTTAPSVGDSRPDGRRRRAAGGDRDADLALLGDATLGVAHDVAELVDPGVAGQRRVHERTVGLQHERALGGVALEQHGRARAAGWG